MDTPNETPTYQETGPGAPASPTLADVLTAVKQLAENDPAAVFALMKKVVAIAVGADYPALGVRVVFDEEYEVNRAVLLDPYTGQETSLIIEDRATREIEHGEDELDISRMRIVMPAPERGTDFAGDIYLSSATRRPVSLPQGWRVEWT